MPAGGAKDRWLKDWADPLDGLKSVCVITGHYGVGKTNFALNLARDAAAEGLEVRLVDLDVVNPYFRSSDYAEVLEQAGVQLVAPLFAGTTLDNPGLSPQVSGAIEWAQPHEGEQGDAARSLGRLAIIDAGGDDAGATALGCSAKLVKGAPYDLLYVVNRSRNLTHEPGEAVAILREVEGKCHLTATAVVNNTHLQAETTPQVIEAGIPFAFEVARECGLPLACTCVPDHLSNECLARISLAFSQGDQSVNFYAVSVLVSTPWGDQG